MQRLKNPVIPDYRQKVKAETKEMSTPSKPCIVCKKACEGYGQWSMGQTCSRDCESVQASKPLYPEHGSLS